MRQQLVTATEFWLNQPMLLSALVEPTLGQHCCAKALQLDSLHCASRHTLPVGLMAHWALHLASQTLNFGSRPVPVDSFVRIYCVFEVLLEAAISEAAMSAFRIGRTNISFVEIRVEKGQGV